MNYWDILLAEKLKKDPPLPPIPDNAYLLEEATGDVITLTDAAALPMPTATSTLAPIQDLHGYSSPWVGGAGKNLFDEIYANISDTLIYRAIAVTNGTYTMSTSVPYNANGATLFLLAGNVSSGASTSVNGVDIYTTRTVTTTDGYVTVAYRTVSNGAINPANYQTQLEQGTQATSYEPYSNICPISGYDSASYNRCGVNVWDEEWELGTFDANGNEVSASDRIRSKNNIKCYPEQTMFFNSPNYGYLYFYDSYNNFISSLTKAPNTTFTSPNNAVYMRFRLDPAYGTTYNHDISINYPSTITTYQPYQGQAITLTFDNTIYSGVIDWCNGVVTVDKASKTFTEVQNKNTAVIANDVYVVDTITDGAAPTSTTIAGDFITNEFKATSLFETTNNAIYGAFMNSTKILQIGMPNSTTTSVNTYLASNPLQIVYQLATPTTITLTTTQLKTLAGYNTIYTDVGNITLEYWRKEVRA